MAKTNTSFMRQIAYTIPVTPNDDVDLPLGVTRALLVGTSADVAVVYENGMEDTVFLAAGIFHPMQVKQVKATGTSATNIRAGY